MIAELGLAALWLAAALAVLQLVAGALAVRQDVASGEAGAEASIADLTRPATIVQGVFAALSFVALLYVFAITDLSVKLVAGRGFLTEAGYSGYRHAAVRDYLPLSVPVL